MARGKIGIKILESSLDLFDVDHVATIRSGQSIAVLEKKLEITKNTNSF